MNHMLQYDPQITIAIEPKPNEPMDHAYIPTIGHALAMASQTVDPKRVGGLIETAHALLAGLDPSDEMAFALSMGKLWSVHLNDQNGLKFDQDKTFGAANLRGAYNQVRVLELGGYPATGRFVGLDVKAMRHAEARGGHAAPLQQPRHLPQAGGKGPHLPQGRGAAVHRRPRLRGPGAGGDRAPACEIVDSSQ